MNNKTQPTPEQLAKWREDADTSWLNDSSILKNEGAYTAYTKGYVRANQENEQAMKLAKFGAMVCSANKIIELPAMAATCGIYANGKLTPNIEAAIKELLK